MVAGILVDRRAGQVAVAERRLQVDLGRGEQHPRERAGDVLVYVPGHGLMQPGQTGIGVVCGQRVQGVDVSDERPQFLVDVRPAE